MPAILKGIQQCMEQGPLTGSYARDVRVVVNDGKMHPVDSNELSFMLAARNAFNQAFREAGPKLLEPIYDVVVQTPEEYLGDVMSDLQNRRGVICGLDADNRRQQISAKVPLSGLLDYAPALTACTKSSSSFEMNFASYELCPAEIQQKLIEQHAKEVQEE